MAGYMKKLNGYVYDGEHTAKVAMTNGIFAEIDTDGTVKPLAAAGDMELRVDEITTLWGKPAVVLNVVVPGTNEHYFVENDFGDRHDECNYDDAEYTCRVGDYVRMHRPVINDQLIMTVEKTLADALKVGDVVKPAAEGTVAKA